MSEVETTIDIAASPEEVWALAMDPERLADWVTIHRRLDDHSDGHAHLCDRVQLTLSMRRIGRPVIRFCGFKRRTLSEVIAAIR